VAGGCFLADQHGKPTTSLVPSFGAAQLNACRTMPPSMYRLLLLHTPGIFCSGQGGKRAAPPQPPATVRLQKFSRKSFPTTSRRVNYALHRLVHV